MAQALQPQPVQLPPQPPNDPLVPLPAAAVFPPTMNNVEDSIPPARDRVMYYILYLLHGRVVLLAVTTVGHDTLLYRVLPPLSVYINIF